ncbi:TPA: hypothetical protein JXS72_002195 [Escherichia coli]|nr:hypothetical protein [Escherichia coli]
MSKIDYQALREKAEKATCGVWSLEYGEGRFDGDDALIHREAAGYIPICRIEGAHPESGFDEDFQMEQQANAEFIAAANPATVLALLDELENKVIPVSAELPPANESVLLFDANGEGWLIGWRSLWYIWGQKETREWLWTFQVGDLENVNITHWAVMPKAPEAGA